MLLSMEGQKALGFPQKYLCVLKMNEGLTGLDEGDSLMTELKCLGELSLKLEVPDHRFTTHYRPVEEFLLGRENVLGKFV